MTKLPEPRKPRAQKTTKRRQISIAFDSRELYGLTSAQRIKAVMQLSRVLMLAAGATLEENDDER